MDKSKIEKIEKQTPEELQERIKDPDSKEGELETLNVALAKLMDEPDLFYLDVDKDGRYAAVKKRADDTAVFYTHESYEIEMLKAVGVGK